MNLGQVPTQPLSHSCCSAGVESSMAKHVDLDKRRKIAYQLLLEAKQT